VARDAKDRSTGDVLADLRFADAEEPTAKTVQAKKVNDAIDTRHVSQSDAAELPSMPQPKVSAATDSAASQWKIRCGP
jgi:predicted XRE-type DNA-binding protein